jgi:molybdopterin molybdotransferase
MPTFLEARQIIVDSVSPLGAERLPVFEAQQRVTCEDLFAGCDIPPFANSAMDGFAVCAAECRVGGSLPVVGAIMAGDRGDEPLSPGTAVKIMTGAPVPPGCDAVVPLEEVAGAGDRIVLQEVVQEGQHIRRQGEDVVTGGLVVSAGTLLRPMEVSMLVSTGRLLVPVRRRPRVAILSTGDELVEPGESLVPGTIVNSNAFALAAAVRQAGAEPTVLGIARDDLASHRLKLAEGLKADALITSAGVSAGERDLVRDVLAELGVEPVFWKIDVKPGGPTAFGLKDGKPVFSLPGNPVSTLLTFEMFVRPALLRMMGHRKVFRPLLPATLAHAVRKKPGKTHLLRVRVDADHGGLRVASAGNQQTGILSTLLFADGVAVLPADRAEFRAGETVHVQLLDDAVLMQER